MNTLVGDAVEIPAMPATLARVLERLNDPKTSAAALAQVMRSDQGLTARVLKIANSAFYGLPRAVETVQQAVVILGTKTVRGLVIGESSKSLYGSKSPLIRNLWEHSMAAAVAAHLAAKKRAGAIGEQAFVAGLMHDVGKVLMLSSSPDKFERAVNLGVEGQRESVETEQEVFTFSHPQAGAELIRRWHLPEGLEHAVLYHHDIEGAAAAAPQDLELVCIVAVANQICHALGIGTGRPPQSVDLRHHPAARELGLEQGDVDGLIAEVAGVYEKEKHLFG